eukprot:COSAG06_NODE_4442_length_4261_cov_1.741951_4_plen_121_part_01
MWHALMQVARLLVQTVASSNGAAGYRDAIRLFCLCSQSLFLFGQESAKLLLDSSSLLGSQLLLSHGSPCCGLCGGNPCCGLRLLIQPSCSLKVVCVRSLWFWFWFWFWFWPRLILDPKSGQ